MYERFFGLNEPPFDLTPDPRFLWLSETHEEGLATLYYGITRRKGFMLLTGEVGLGKTTLLRTAISQISQETEIALVLNTTQLGPVDLLKLIAEDFEIRGDFVTKVDYLIALNRYLLDRLDAGLNTVVVIDEAQNLDEEILEEVRLLSNLETDSEKLLQIVLVGQPELHHKLARPSLRQLRQRVALEHEIEPLGPHEIESYLAHRIQTAGGRYDEIFAPGCDKPFYEFSRGAPRLVSQLADRVLLAAYAKKTRQVTPELVAEKALRPGKRPRSAPQGVPAWRMAV